MNLLSKKNIKFLLKKYGIRPSRGLGQNFLIDRTALKNLMRTVEPSPKDTVLEIGAGIGVITQELAKKVGKVVAVEKDPQMVEILKETLKNFKNIKIIRGDILRVKFQMTNSKSFTRPNFCEAKTCGGQVNSKFQIPKNYKIVANLPFYLTAPVIRKFLESVEVKPQQMMLMVQKEVAQRICASPAKISKKFRRARPPRMNILAVSVQVYAEPKIISYVPKKSFWPSPKVDAAILKINSVQKTDDRRFIAEKENRDLFFKIVKAGFSHPRKQIDNNLAEGLAPYQPKDGTGLALGSPNGLKLNKARVESWLLENGIRPSQRAENLTIKNWLNLTKTFKTDGF